MAGELAAEWIKIPDGNGNLQKVWVRDSTARRDIAQLQTDVSGKADAATTLAGYGITDAYTKTQVDGMIPSVPSAYTSNPEMDGTASPGSSTAWARGDHVHPSDTSKQDALSTAQLNAVNSGITAAKVSTYDAISVPTAYTSNPAMDGTASAGSSTSWARGDHVHPTDTSRQAALSTAQLNAVNSGITAAKVSTYDAISVPSASSSSPVMDGTAAVGTSNDYARADHVHPADTSKQDALSTAQLNALSALLNIHTVSGTTNANGDILLFSNTNTHVIAAWGSYLCMPFVYSSKTYARMLKVAGSGTTYTPMASTSVTVNYIAI